jgi:hypothetical protein
MTNPAPAGTMRDARLIETEILLPKPKRFVRENLIMPDGYECDSQFVDTPARCHGRTGYCGPAPCPGAAVPAQPEVLPV